MEFFQLKFENISKTWLFAFLTSPNSVILLMVKFSYCRLQKEHIIIIIIITVIFIIIIIIIVCVLDILKGQENICTKISESCFDWNKNKDAGCLNLGLFYHYFRCQYI